MSKLLTAFTDIHGEISSKFSVVVEENDETGEDIAVAVMQDGHLCWRVTREELAFELAFRAFKTQEACTCCQCEKPNFES